MIKNILFDMGNVLIHFDRKVFLDRLDISEDDKQLLLREVFLSVEWVQMDRGTLREETAEPLMCKRLPEHLHDAVHQLVSCWDEPMLPIAGMAELVEELKRRATAFTCCPMPASVSISTGPGFPAGSSSTARSFLQTKRS